MLTPTDYWRRTIPGASIEVSRLHLATGEALPSLLQRCVVIKKILMVLVVAVVCVGILAMRQPDTYTVERRAVVKAPVDSVFAQINDFHHWKAWSPWARLDTAMTLKISDPGVGNGATYEWKGNSDVGEGKMEIKESMAPSKVTIDLHFISPIDSKSVTTFQLEPKDGGTEVIWTMRGDHSFMSKVMSVFTSMDKMIGPDFEKGLSQMQTAVSH